MGNVCLNINNPMNVCAPDPSNIPDKSVHIRDELNNTGKDISGRNNQDTSTGNEQSERTVKVMDCTHLKFQVHDKTGDIIVKVIDDNTGEVLKEIPPEKILDMIDKFQEIDGLFIDEKR